MTRQRGFTYLAALFAIALVGLALAGTGEVWHKAARREREAQLLWVGTEYRLAIQSYYDHSPGAKEYPQRLSDLLRDNRYPFVLRHLRQLYPDPVTNGSHWGLLMQGNRIIGVYSLAAEQPIKQSGFPEIYRGFEKQENYRGWVFSALERESPAAAGQ